MKMGLNGKMRALLVGAAIFTGFAAWADATVWVDDVRVSDPWTTIAVDYTLGDVDAGLEYKLVFDVTVMDVTRTVTNAPAKLVNGRATRTFDVTTLFDSPKADPKAQVAITVIAVKPKPDGVPLGEGGHGSAAQPGATVTIDKVAVSDPWTTVKVDYTLGGLDPDIDYQVAFDITARGVTRGVTNAPTKLAEGSASQTIDVMTLFDPAQADPKAKVAITLFAMKPETSVQLWADGPRWATCNLGAKKPSESGFYFWWGDTKGYVRFGDTWQSFDGTVKGFEFSRPNCPTYEKMSLETMISEGWIDASGALMPEHDAARVHLGAPWRMPTYEEIKGLVEQCDWEWTSWDGVNGALVKGKGAYAGKSIFLPTTGYVDSTDLRYVTDGLFWSALLDKGYDGGKIFSYHLNISSKDHFAEDYCRYNGLAIRPVR